MPRYRVLKRGFYGGTSYSPEGKRSVLLTEAPFPYDKKSKKEQVPSWLERIKDETPAQKKSRETKAANTKKAADAKAEQDKVDTDAVTFMGDGAPGSTVVETLG